MNLITKVDEGLRPLVGDLTGQVLVLAHNRLNRRYQMPRFQIFKATGGFGCQEGSLGRAVFGFHVADNEDARWDRNDFIGIATHELIERALEDTTPVLDINLDEREYIVIAHDGSTAKGDTPDQVMSRLRRITSSRVKQAYLAHPESRITDFGFVMHPKGAPPSEVKLKKRGGNWIDAT